MLTKIKNTIFSLALLMTTAVPLMVPVAAYAACTPIQQGINTGAGYASGQSTTCGDSNSTNFSKIAANVVNIFSMIVGAVAIIMIIYGGFKYITSGGDSGNVTAAKNTLIYAIIGLIIVALSQFIVHFVLNGASNAVG
jgi:hypothetical protein